ncbi:MAG: tetratricopeptide repeat protein [Chloroflexi bacterium]|nr:tetratricopeptide repeat protein [Chloroflexota bacterium]
MNEKTVGEFVRRLKGMMENHDDSKFVFFLGSGCSVSSGIPDAAGLVRRWLPRLKKFITGNEDNWEEWAPNFYPGYEDNKASWFYARVIEDLFPLPEERQKEIERLIEGKDPGYGYCVLAKLMSHEKYRRHCNCVLTVNFDDLAADALYLYTSKKPLVIPHDSLIGFVKITGTRPVIIKLHGDARLDPRNTDAETNSLADNVKDKLKKLLPEAGLVFIGYGGNDESIAEILEDLPSNSLEWGIYWVGDSIPESRIGRWLEEREAFHVKHFDFDQLMAYIQDLFDLENPDEKRFEKLIDNYKKTFNKLMQRIKERPEEELTEEKKQVIERVDSKFEAWKIMSEAQKYEKNDPEKANGIYEEGIKKLPDNAYLFNDYGFFLEYFLKEYNKAETSYKRCIEIEPDNALYNARYAEFLSKIREDYEKAEGYYKKALEIEPDNTFCITRYAEFLSKVRKDYDKAESHFKRALEIEPDNALYNALYAEFLSEVRKDYDKAESHFKRALEIEPDRVYFKLRYDQFLSKVSKGYI